jgi:vancomycin aglycone glucosyltransferase
MLALAKALMRRGHDPVLACPPHFAPWVEAHDVAHRELGEDLSTRMRGGLSQTAGRLKHYFSEQLTQQATQLLAIASDADAVVSTGMAWTAPSVAERLGLPALMVLPSVAALRSRLYPPPLTPWFGLPAWFNAALWSLHELAMNRMMGAPLNVARAQLGLPKVASFADHLFLGTPSVVAADVALLPAGAETEREAVGALLLDDFDALDGPLEDWLGRGEAPIYVGFGSMHGRHCERVGRLLVEALRGRRCVVSGSLADTLAQAGLPDNFFLVREAPHPQLFSRVACVVHHGGAGTTTSALRAGVPQVLLPVLLDQHLHAYALSTAHLAPRAPKLAGVTVRELQRAIKHAFGASVRRRRDAADRIQSSAAGATIVDMLERSVGV